MTTEALSADEQRLAELGYKQELKRGWSSFSNFAISFSIISVLAGCFTSYGQAFLNGGPVAISIGWPVICCLILCVAFSMAELASAMPTAGGIYYWASKLGGPGWGWFTGWFNLIGLVAVRRLGRLRRGELPAGAAEPVQRRTSSSTSPSTNVHYNAHVVFAAVPDHPDRPRADQRLLQPPGVAVQRRLGLVARRRRGRDRDHPGRRPEPSRELLVRVRHSARYGGFSHHMYWFYMLPLGFLLTMYTITGYDASAHVSEETNDAAMSAPEGRLALGLLLGRDRLDPAAGADVRGRRGPPQHDQRGRLPGDRDPHHGAAARTAAKLVLLISTVGQLFCGMACVTSASRMTFAFSRDGAVPGHNLWRRLGANRTPTWAVLFVCVMAAARHDPRLLPEQRRLPGCVLRGHVDLRDRALHRLHDPDLPALADGRCVPAGTVDARWQVQVGEPDRDRLGRASA